MIRPLPRPDTAAAIPLPANVQQAALATASEIATALDDPATVWNRARPTGRAWPQSLAGGAAGIALLHVTRARTGHGDWRTADTWLRSAVNAPLTGATNAGLFVGAPALAYVIGLAAGPGRYARTLARLNDATITVTERRLAAAHARIHNGRLPHLAEFDLIRGLTGLGAYHLQRHPDHPITTDVITYLIRFTEPVPGATGRPAWWTGQAPSGEPDPAFPNGHGNLGLAHGIGAVLALLSLAVLDGHPTPGIADAIARICAWTDQLRHDGADGPWWPGYVTDITNNPPARPRPSWCYGIAGTARAQQLAGQALNDKARQRTAATALLTAIRDRGHLGLLGDETGLCHGTAGLLHATWRTATGAGRTGSDHELTGELPTLTNRLLDQLSGNDPAAHPELLDGAAGAALVLHDIATNTAPNDTGRPAWDRFLLQA